jgi:hypothetical protein
MWTAEAFGLFVDARHAGQAESGTGKRQMAWMSEHADALRSTLAGMASVVPAEQVERDQANTAKLARHLPFPCAVYATEEECRAWLVERLKAVQPR